MLNAVIHAPEPKPADPEPLDATKVVPLPVIPGKAKRAGKGADSGSSADSGPGGKRSEEAGERFRGAFRSAKKAAVAAGGGSSDQVHRLRPDFRGLRFLRDRGRRECGCRRCGGGGREERRCGRGREAGRGCCSGSCRSPRSGRSGSGQRGSGQQRR